MIFAVLLTLALTLLAWEAWDRLIKPHLLQALADDEDAFKAKLDAFLQLTASTVEKELPQVLTQIEQDAIAAVKALVADKQAIDADHAQAQAQIADLQSQVSSLQTALDAEKADHADLVSQLQGVLNPQPAG